MPLHCLPHMPQFIGSVCVFVHALLQIVSPILQHMPCKHCCIIGSHGLPHMPQLSMSVFTSTHAPEHSIFGDGQMMPHVPMLQPYMPPPGIAPASLPQSVPHFPQFWM